MPDLLSRSKRVNLRGHLADLPLIRAYRQSSIPYHVGSVWGNRLGLQVVRVTSQYAQFCVRRRTVPAELKGCVETIEKDGIVMIEDFLAPGLYEQVLAEYEGAIKQTEMQPYKGSSTGRLYRTQITLSETANPGSVILKTFQQNSFLNGIASAVIRRKISRTPDVHLDWYQGVGGNGTDNDVENILHADLHTPTVKMFFYLDRVDETNGAFIYAKGSHRMTLPRVLHEYELSIRQAKLRKGVEVDGSLIETRGDEKRNVISPRYRRMMQVVETPISVRANTLVIANNMGFHRRGEFPSGRPRKSVQINYRYLEQPFGKRFLVRNR